MCVDALIDDEKELSMVIRSHAALSIAAPALPLATWRSVPCRDVTQVGARDEIRLVATLMEDAVLDGLELELPLRRLGELSVDQEAQLTASGIPLRSTPRVTPITILPGVLALAGEVGHGSGVCLASTSISIISRSEQIRRGDRSKRIECTT